MSLRVLMALVTLLVPGEMCPDKEMCTFCYGPYYEKMRLGHDLYACTYRCNPSADTSCYVYAPGGSRCLNFEQAKVGTCRSGVCYNDTRCRELKDTPLGKRTECPFANDFHYLKRSGYGNLPFGCKHYCRRSHDEHGDRPDGTKCLIPETAQQLLCDDVGQCTRRRSG
uniref:7DB family n=1 Tax=Argas monolakensis TaxID=34602 RepID=Q09JJ1_ARGMO|nr:7DB family [Argas monolakensis]